MKWVNSTSDLPIEPLGDYFLLPSERGSARLLVLNALNERILGLLTSRYQEKETHIGSEAMRRFEKTIMLNTLDTHWKEHLSQMEYLRQSIFLRGYAQKDPRQEYKREAFNLFKTMLESIKRQVISTLSLVEIQAASDVEAAQMMDEARRQASSDSMEFLHAETMSSLQLTEESDAIAMNEKMSAAGGSFATVMRAQPKVGRNDLCPCGSKKKYKHCHGRLE